MKNILENRKVVSHDDWIEARRQFLAKEKEFTRLRDQLSQQRRDLPWERVEREYVFDGPNGQESLSELFAGKSQLIVYHFMFGPDWEAGCPSCSHFADNFNGMIVHLNQCDVAFVAVSRAPSSKLEAYTKRMGWSFKWVSSSANDFNRDYHVSYAPEEVAKGRPITTTPCKNSRIRKCPGPACSTRTQAAKYSTPIRPTGTVSMS